MGGCCCKGDRLETIAQDDEANCEKVLNFGGRKVSKRNIKSLFSISPTELKWMGRIVLTDHKDVAVYDWPAVSFETTFTCSKECDIWVRMKGGRNHFNVYMDRKMTGILKTSGKFYEYMICKKLEPGTHHLRVVKRTEPKTMNLISTYPVELHCIVFDSDGVITTPPKTEGGGVRRKICFFGDSDTAPFGNEAKRSNPENPFNAFIDPITNNSEKSWAVVASNMLQADYQIMAISGIGVHRNLSCLPYYKDTMATLYNRLVATDASSACEQPDWDPDCVVVYIGGNDVYELVSPIFGCKASQTKREALMKKIRVSYTEFLDRLREFYPQAKIVVLMPDLTSYSSSVSPQGQEDIANLLQSLIQPAVQKTNDPNTIACIVDANQQIQFSDDSYWGAVNHWSNKSHKVWGDAVASILAKEMNWTIATVATK